MGRGVITARSSRRSKGDTGPGHRGGTCPRSSGRGRRSGNGSNRWSGDGTLDKLLAAAHGDAEIAGELEWMVSVDSTIARAHQHAAGAPKIDPEVSETPAEDAGGRGRITRNRRSRRCSSSRLIARSGVPAAACRARSHLCCDGRGLPLSFTVTAGQAGDDPQARRARCDLGAAGRPGRPRSRPERLLADKAYSHPSTRAALRARGIKATIPERDDQLARRRARGPGRPYAFDTELYKQRNVVERCFNRLKQWRGSPPATTRPTATTAVASYSPASFSGPAHESGDTP